MFATIHLIPSKELIEHISETGFDPQFGARPLKRMIQKELFPPGFIDEAGGAIIITGCSKLNI